MKDKVYTIIGTRPEIIRLARIMPKLDAACHHTIIHTNQNCDYKLRDIFFDDLCLRKPDVTLEVSTSMLSAQISNMFVEVEKIFLETRPDKVLILGDTNSGLCAIIAERMGIPVYHMEAGNRCFDKRVPEEVNRRIIDSISAYNMPYTPHSRENLIREGNNTKKLFMCGNPIMEVLAYYHDRIRSRRILDKLNLKEKKYFLADFHRAETVDIPERLTNLIAGLNKVAKKFNRQVICSIHPRTREKLKAIDVKLDERVSFLEPFGFLDFVKLEQSAECVLSDSGLVSEETCMFGTPCVIIRDTTERPEIVESGSAMISGLDPDRMLMCTELMIGRKGWQVPVGHNDPNVSDKVVNFILGERQ